MTATSSIKRKYTIYITLLLVLGCLLILWFFLPKWFLTEQYKFSVKPVSSIVKIEISKDNQSLTLTKNEEGQWLINEQKIADPLLMETMVKILGDMQVREALTSEQQKTLRLSAGEAVKVKIFQNRGLFDFSKKGFFPQQTKRFWVNTLLEDEQAVCMQHTTSQDGYWVYVPGYQSAWKSFFQTAPDYYRTREILNVNNVDIQSVDVTFPENQTQSWSLKHTPEGYVLQGKSDSQPLLYNRQKLIDYLSSFTRIYHEQWLNGNVQEADRKQMEKAPFFILAVKDKQGQETIFKGFPKYKILHDSLILDPDRLLLLLNQDKDTVEATYFMIDPLCKPLDYFRTN